MGQRHTALTDAHIAFIEAQKLFFVGTAPAAGRVNVSPKGMDSLRVLDPSRVLWLNLTGSGNETAAHVQEDPRMTLMFAAFEGRPLILRVYGNARAIHHTDADWKDLVALFDPIPGARQLFDLRVDLVQTSCGMGVPLFDFVAERDQLKDWARRKGAAGLRQYWRDKNAFSLDGRPTHIIDKNG
jgi:hypothetical protein